MVSSRTKKWEAFLKVGIGLVLLVLINILAKNYFFRLDLTEENRYTITDATKATLRALEEEVYIEVYLEGDFPAGFKRLQNAIREQLEEFRSYAGYNLQYKFVDPGQAENTEARNQFYKNLAQKGIQPTNLFANEDGKRIEKLIFPGALVSYQGKESAVMLLKGNQAASPDERLNQSIEGIEYEFMSTIRKLSEEHKKKIALIRGHGELDSLQIAGLTNALLEYFQVFHVDLPQKDDLEEYDALVIAKPTSPFSEADKYKIDQFIMRSGKALFFMESLRVNMDSAGNQGTYAFPYETNLDDLLFRYGIRVNKNLIQDLNSGAHPVVTGFMGDQPQIKILPWPFYPIINYFGAHPVVKNMDAVYARFVSSIDTVKAEGILKTPLFSTSTYSRVLAAPVLVSLNSMRVDVVPENFTTGPVPVAFLLEGQFSSLYRNRIIPEGVSQNNFLEKGESSKIIVVADGDFVRNEIDYKKGSPYDLGYDPFMDVTFANKDFLLNAMNYLLDENGVIKARAKEIAIRPLDKIAVQENKLEWQLFNLILPILIITLYGIGRYYYRKRQYSRFGNG